MDKQKYEKFLNKPMSCCLIKQKYVNFAVRT